MALAEKITLYEVFIRFNPDGFQGAYQRNFHTVVDEVDGRLIGEFEGGKIPLTREAIAPLMDAQFVPMAEQIVELFFERDQLVAKIAALETEVADLKKAIPYLADPATA